LLLAAVQQGGQGPPLGPDNPFALATALPVEALKGHVKQSLRWGEAWAHEDEVWELREPGFGSMAAVVPVTLEQVIRKILPGRLFRKFTGSLKVAICEENDVTVMGRTRPSATLKPQESMGILDSPPTLLTESSSGRGLALTAWALLDFRSWGGCLLFRPTIWTRSHAVWLPPFKNGLLPDRIVGRGNVQFGVVAIGGRGLGLNLGELKKLQGNH